MVSLDRKYVGLARRNETCTVSINLYMLEIIQYGNKMEDGLR
jgi:hypothetical protein